MTGSAPSDARPVVAPSRPSLHRVLERGWTLRSLDERLPATDATTAEGGGVGPLPASVPGWVHLDLAHSAATAGGVPSPDHDTGRVDWRYTLELDTTPEQLHDHVELVFDGLDTLATVSLDGRLVGVAADMHRRHRFDLTGALRRGPQRLTVDLASPARHAEMLRARAGRWPAVAADDVHAWVRTLAPDSPVATSGARLASPVGTAGIWRPVRLHAWSGARLDEVRIETEVDDDDHGRVTVVTPVVSSPRLIAALDVVVEHVLTDATGTVVAAESTPLAIVDDRAELSVVLEPGRVQRWWPRSLGRPHRYRLSVRLVHHGVELDRWSGTLGFRTVELDTRAEVLGSRFVLVVNGEQLFARGAARVVAAPPARRHADAVRDELALWCEANVDLVRVRGIYEDDEFYEACDELGLLVWQDLPFAGAAYPEHLLRDEVRAEVRDNVLRLHHHPSLAVWNGNHECQHAHAALGWSEVLHERAWGEGFWTDDVPLVLEELDPSRPYWPGSPNSGPSLTPNSDLHGTCHVQVGTDGRTRPRVRDHASRFVAELTLVDATERRDVQRDIQRARSVRLALEHFRSLRGHCSGTVWRPLDRADLRPDHASPSNRSLEWHAVRSAYADRLATVQPRGHELRLHLVNDGPGTWWAKGRVERITLDGTVRIGQTLDVVVGARSQAHLSIDPCLASPRDRTNEVLVVDVGGVRAWWWFADDVELPLAPLQLDGRVIARAPDRLALSVTSATVVRDLVVRPELLLPGLTVDRQLVSLRPGQAETFTVDGPGAGELDPQALLAPPVTSAAAALLRGV